jgi:hypothetical protein
MRSTTTLLAAAVTAVALVTPAATAAPTGAGTPHHVRDVCGAARPGQVRCLAEVRTDVHGGRGVRGPAARADATSLPSGYGPADLRSAYGLPVDGGVGQTVAIVDAGDDAAAEADLAVYRATYGLPACTTANGCLRTVNQRGDASPLPPDQGWATEISLDLDLVSAACRSCHLLLVEADDAGLASMAAAVDTAAALGATEISNRYGATENATTASYAAHYRHPGVAVVAASGDAGYGAPNMPAVFAGVVAVGGTSLTRAGNARGFTEAAWSGAGTGCSAWVDKPAWQSDPNCPGRMVSDVSAVADPDTGPAVYDTSDQGGWTIVGGTSASAPFIAGVIALAGHPDRFADASYLYAHASALHDVVGGASAGPGPGGADCGGDYLCTGFPGYDGPTGNGTPDGLGAF